MVIGVPYCEAKDIGERAFRGVTVCRNAVVFCRIVFQILLRAAIYNAAGLFPAIFQQPPIVVPFPEHYVIAGVFNEFGQPACKYGGIGLFYLNRIYADAPIKRREIAEIIPDCFVFF